MAKKKTVSLYDVKAIVHGNNETLLVVVKEIERPFMKFGDRTYKATSSIAFDQKNAVISFEIDE